MKIKRYVDSDMRHVLRRVRQDQGPDAVILSNRRVDDGIEVIAAVDYDEALMDRALGRHKAVETQSSDAPHEVSADDGVPASLQATAEEWQDMPPMQEESESPAAEDSPDTDIVATQMQPVSADLETAADAETLVDPIESAESLREVRNELSSLRALVEAQLAGLLWNDNARRSPMRAQVLRNLAHLGIAPDVANIVVNRLPPTDDMKQSWRAPLTELAQLFPVTEDTLLTEGGTVALIGPTGVGKTTTIAKLAARYSMQHGSDEIALICADAYRIGAKEHLTAFGNIIGVKVHAASTSAELSELLQRLQSRKLILIDTEGMSQRDLDLSSRLAAYGGNDERVRFYLTLSAACQEAVLDETIRGFSRVPLTGTIVTKIDEAAQIGCVLSAMIRHDLPAAWFSNGQRIPDDLHQAARKRLWLINQAVECMQLSEPKVTESLLAERYGPASAAHA